MTSINHPIVDQFLITFITQFFLVFGIIGLVISVGIIFYPERMHKFFLVMNRCISLRRSTKWLAIPRDISQPTQRFRRLIGSVFIIAAISSTFILITQTDVPRIVAAFGVSTSYSSFIAWIFECAVWSMIVGNMLAIVVGIMLIFFPDALHEIEIRTNRWYSFRSHSQGGDTMHLAIDKWVERYPRSTGGVIAAGSLIVVISHGILLAHS